MSGLLHVVAAELREGAPEAALDRAAALARALPDADGAEAVLVGRSEDRLVVATWLADRRRLEPFAASDAHMQFVMRGLAPVAARMWSAAVEVDEQAAAGAAGAETLWAFALPARDGLYEWQVRQLLADVGALPGAAAAGPTVEERERFRAAGVVGLAGDQSTAFERALAGARERWAGNGDIPEEAVVRVQ